VYLALCIVAYGACFGAVMDSYQLELSADAYRMMEVFGRHSIATQFTTLLLVLAAGWASNNPGYMHVAGSILGAGGIALFYTAVVAKQWWENYVSESSPNMLHGLAINALIAMLLGITSLYPVAKLDAPLEEAIKTRLKGGSSYTGLAQQAP